MRTSRRRVGKGTATALLALVATAGLLAGCGGSDSAGAPMTESKPQDAVGAQGDAAREAGPTAALPAGGTDKTATSVLVGEQRAVIRTATVQLRADDVLVAARQAVVVVQSGGGQVSGEQTTVDPDHPERTVSMLTLRVPEAKLAAVLQDLADLGTVLAQDQTATDVTGQVVDVAARIKTQTESVARVRALLARARTIGEIVQIESELTARQAELESLQAQAKALADQTAMATVTLTVVGPDPAGTQDDETGFVAGLRRGWDAFVTTFTWLVTALGLVLPFALLALALALPLVALARRSRRPQARPDSVRSDLVHEGDHPAQDVGV